MREKCAASTSCGQVTECWRSCSHERTTEAGRCRQRQSGLCGPLTSSSANLCRAAAMPLHTHGLCVPPGLLLAARWHSSEQNLYSGREAAG